MRKLLLLMGLLSLWAAAGVNLAAAAPPSVDLTELSIEELMNLPVRGAARYEQKPGEAPSSVTVVTMDEIKKYGYRTLADILRSIRSFYVTGDRNYEYLGVRGFGRPGDYNNRVLLLLDGHRLNDNIYDSAYIGTDFPLDVDLIDRVEIIRGPSSSLYGANAFFAVINVITRPGRTLKGVEVSGEGGGFYTYKGRLTYGNRFTNGLEMMASGSYYNSRGPRNLYFREFDAPETNNGLARECDYDRYQSFFGNLAFRDFTLSGVYHSREKGIPTAAWGTYFNDPRSRSTDTRAYLDLKYERTLAEQWGIMARLYYDRYRYDGNYLYNLADPGDRPFLSLNRDYALGQWWGGEAQVTRKILDRHKVIVGMEYRDNLAQNQGSYFESPYVKLMDDKRDSKLWALYAQGELELLKQLRLFAGVRYDHYDTFGGTANPRVGLICTPFKPTTIKLLYGTAFRAPNVYELYYQDGGVTTKANPDLKPETIRTYELVWEQFLTQNLRLSTSGFIYQIRDLISQTTDPADGLIVFRNLEKVHAKGVEVELAGRWVAGWEGRLSYSFQEAKNQETGDLLTNSPKHLAKFNLIAPLIQRKLFAGLEWQYLSRRRTIDNSWVGDTVITNLTLFSKNLYKSLELSATVYNLFDQKYSDPGAAEHLVNNMGAIRQNGRNFRFKLTYLF